MLRKTDFLCIFRNILNIFAKSCRYLRITISITICSLASKNLNNLSYTSTKIGNYEKIFRKWLIYYSELRNILLVQFFTNGYIPQNCFSKTYQYLLIRFSEQQKDCSFGVPFHPRRRVGS